MFVMSSCATPGARPETDSLSADSACSADISTEAEAWADSVFATMTTEEKIGQLIMPAVYSRCDAYSLNHALKYVTDRHIGGLILLKGTTTDARELIDSLQAHARVPLFIAIDAEWGLGMRLTDAPVYPMNERLGQYTDDRPLYDYGAEVAKECRQLGINMVLGPVLDVRQQNGGGFIGKRSFGPDSERVGDLGVAYARGLEDGGVLSVAKHFPGHGSPSADSHRQMPVISKSLHALDSLDLRPFRDYIAGGLSGIMVGHLAVPAIDPIMRPAAFSPVVINDLLREEMGFRGLIMTDAINMEGAGHRGASDALQSGADIILAPVDTERELSSIAALPAARLDSLLSDRVLRILFFKYLFLHPN